VSLLIKMAGQAHLCWIERRKGEESAKPRCLRKDVKHGTLVNYARR